LAPVVDTAPKSGILRNMKNTKEAYSLKNLSREELQATITQGEEALVIFADNGTDPEGIAWTSVAAIIEEAKALLPDSLPARQKAKADKKAAEDVRKARRQEAYGGPNGEEPCPFCNGGIQAWNSHVRGGICFRCNGKGY